MSVTQEQLTARLALLTQTREELMAQVNACIGAMQECDYWLEQLKKEEA